MTNHTQIYINGEWVAPSSNETIDVFHSTTEEVLGSTPSATADDAVKACAAARAAFDDWAATSKEDRIALLDKVHEGLVARADDIATAITAEVGMPLKLSKIIQAGNPALHFKQAAGILGEFDFDEEINNSQVVKEPIGVVACITPWNYPLNQITAKVAPALAAGCTVVLKPSEVAPMSAYILAEIIDEAGFPAGVFNMVTGYGPTVGEAMVTSDDVDMVSFTGSTRAGKRISELAAQTVKRVSLELGGKSAAIILDDADLTKAIKGTVGACYLNSGQTCTAHTRVLVPEANTKKPRRLPHRPSAAGPWATRRTRTRGSAHSPPNSTGSGSRTISRKASTAAPRSCSAAPASRTGWRPATSSSRPSSARSIPTRPSPRRRSSAR